MGAAGVNELAHPVIRPIHEMLSSLKRAVQLGEGEPRKTQTPTASEGNKPSPERRFKVWSTDYFPKATRLLLKLGFPRTLFEKVWQNRFVYFGCDRCPVGLASLPQGSAEVWETRVPRALQANPFTPTSHVRSTTYDTNTLEGVYIYVYIY